MKYINPTKSYVFVVDWLAQTGEAAVVTGTPTITIKRYNTATNDWTTIVSAQNMTLVSGSSWCYEVDTTSYTSEADYTVTYSAVVETLTVYAEEDFRIIEDTNALIKELRVGNIRMDFHIATVGNLIRKVDIGMLDYMTVLTKSDLASDWTSPTSTKILYFWYDSSANCISAKESDV